MLATMAWPDIGPIDRFGADPAMQPAAETVPFDAHRNTEVDRIVARHRVHREAVAACAR